MNATKHSLDRAGAEGRTLALLHSAARVLPTPAAASDWLHTQRDELGGLTPAGAAWTGGEAAFVAALMLATLNRT